MATPSLDSGKVEFDFKDSFKPKKGNFWDFLFADSVIGWDKLSFTVMGLDDKFAWEIDQFGGFEKTVITKGQPSAAPIPGGFILLGVGLSRFMAMYRRRKLTAKN